MDSGKEKPTTDAVKEEFPCNICSKSFSAKGEWDTHYCDAEGSARNEELRRRIIEELEETEKPFKCQYCIKRFAQRAFLIIHLRSHTGERPFDCRICGKAFHQQSHLTYHGLTHTAKCNFACPICDKKLRYKQSLQLHLRIHKQEKHFYCDVCGKGFYEKPKLKIHQRIHTGEKPYECFICLRRFAQKGNCDKHVDRYHARDKERKFPCKLCSKSFIWKKCLDMHVAEHYQKKEKVQKTKKKDIVKSTTTMEDSPKEIEIPHYVECSTIIEEIESQLNDIQDNEDFSEMTEMTGNSAEINEAIDIPKGGIVLDETIAKVANVNLGLPMLDPETGANNFKSVTVSYINGDTTIIKKKRRPRQKTLRENVYKLLPVLLDDEVLDEIGWPKKPVEIMVMQILQICGFQPAVAMPDGTKTKPRRRDENEAFQNNVRLLLKIALEEKFPDVNDVQDKTSNEIMIDMLKFCKIK